MLNQIYFNGIEIGDNLEEERVGRECWFSETRISDLFLIIGFVGNNLIPNSNKL